MNCRNFHRNLEDYLDGKLDFAGRFGIERHAEQCFACGKNLADARELRRFAASLARVKAPADFEERISREIALRKSHGLFVRIRNYLSFGFEWRRFAFAGAVCAALIFVIVSAQWIIRHDERVPTVTENINPAWEDELEESPDNYKKDALDLLLVSPDNHYTPERLPRRIYLRYGPPSEEYFIRNVSH